jgi:hypothetical protein
MTPEQRKKHNERILGSAKLEQMPPEVRAGLEKLAGAWLERVAKMFGLPVEAVAECMHKLAWEQLEQPRDADMATLRSSFFAKLREVGGRIG